MSGWAQRAAEKAEERASDPRVEVYARRIVELEELYADQAAQLKRCFIRSELQANELRDENARLRAELSATRQQAVEIARGCRDYGGGYRADDEKLDIYHHGMHTVERSLAAWASGEDSLQLRVVQAIGKETA